MARKFRAFTLLELLIAVAIIAILVALVAVSLRAITAQAGRTDSLGALRQMALAHGQYTQDNLGRLLPGYIDETLFASGQPFEDLDVKLPDGTLLSDADSQSYVWRLAPYVDHAWDTFFQDMRDPGTLSTFQADYANGVYGRISERPSYGLNSIFVGGDSFHGSPSVTGRHPWQTSQPKIAATRLTEVRNPARLIIFAPTARADIDELKIPYTEPQIGYCELRAPYLRFQYRWKEPQWMVAKGGKLSKTTLGDYSATGLPIDRAGGGLIPVANLDGSAAVEPIRELMRDMRRWNPDELALREVEIPFSP